MQPLRNRITVNSRFAIRSAASAVVFFGITLLLSTAQQPFTLRDEHGRIIAVRDLTLTFATAEFAAGVIGLLFVARAARALFSSASGSDARAASQVTPFLPRDSRYWAIINVSLIIACIWTGYLGAHPRHYQNIQARATLCTAVFVGIVIVAVTASSARNAKGPRASAWCRLSTGWSSDPSQALFLATWCSLACVIGGSFAWAVFGGEALQALTLEIIIFLALVTSRAIVSRFHGRAR